MMALLLPAKPLVEGWMPPSRENYELILFFWKFGFILVSVEVEIRLQAASQPC
jgi:hypothetical protein